MAGRNEAGPGYRSANNGRAETRPLHGANYRARAPCASSGFDLAAPAPHKRPRAAPSSDAARVVVLSRTHCDPAVDDQGTLPIVSATAFDVWKPSALKALAAADWV